MKHVVIPVDPLDQAILDGRPLVSQRRVGFRVDRNARVFNPCRGNHVPAAQQSSGHINVGEHAGQELCKSHHV
jgi:hypothetical protein